MPTLEDYIKKYEEKTKDKFKPKEGFKLFYLPDRGFCEIGVITVFNKQQMLVIHQLGGDGKFWRDYATLIAQSLNIKKIGSICIRKNVEAYIRFWGFKITKKEPLDDGSFIYYAKNKEGKTARLAPIHIHDDTSRVSYFVTWEV